MHVYKRLTKLVVLKLSYPIIIEILKGKDINIGKPFLIYPITLVYIDFLSMLSANYSKQNGQLLIKRKSCTIRRTLLPLNYYEAD